MAHDEKLIEEAKAFVDEVWEDVVRDIDYLVQVESVEDKEHASQGRPFGPAPYEAMTRALRIAERLGMSTRDCEGYLGYAELEGEDDDAYIATIAHSDIVPLGEGWTFEPLRVTRKDGYLLGRGVIDDKGPLVLSLYAAHFFARRVRETGARLPHTLRCLVGANEETGMEDVDYYLEHYPAPAFCFTPDALFPLICGEKGILHATVKSQEMDASAAVIVRLDGGTVPNAIPGTAQAIVRAQAAELPPADHIAVEALAADEQGRAQAVVRAQGKGGHASMPEGTLNAIALLVDYLMEQGLCNEDERAFLEFERILLADAYGQALGIAATDDLFDPLTCVGGTVRTLTSVTGTRFVQSMDVRYPKSTTKDAIMATTCEVADRFGCAASCDVDMVPFYVAPESDEIQALLGAYNQVTGRDEQAFTIGGGTYARHFPRAVAFGPAYDDAQLPAWVGIEHGPDEGVCEDDLRQALVVYIVALDRLMRIAY